MTNFLRALLIMLFILQLVVSAGFELAHDEAYYWLYSNNLDWGFFDHPPMVGLVIKIFSFLPRDEWSVRIGFIFLQFMSLFILFRLIDSRYWVRATLMFFAMPLASVAGLLALPDMPLLFFSTCYCWRLKVYLEKKTFRNALLIALVIPLLLYSKYHGILLVFFTLMALPRLFLDKNTYVIAGISLLLFFPHVWWQYEHGFSTLKYHFLERPAASFSFLRSLEYLGIQIVLAGCLVGPLIWWSIFKKGQESEFDRSLKFITIGTLIFFLVTSFSKKIEANWTIFLAAPLLIQTIQHEFWLKRIPSVLLNVSFSLVVLSRLVFLFPSSTFGFKRADEFHGWKKWANTLDEKCSGELMANSYQIASKLSFYLNQEIQSLNYGSRKNQFDYWRFDQKSPTEEVCYVTDKSDFVGEKVLTPEGKKIRFVKGFTAEQLYQRKSAN